VKTCPICGKNDLKHQGALNMHMYHCKIKNVGGQQETPKEEKCEHDWRFLNPSMSVESKAMKHGYKEVCKKCQEVK
jgi:hypothetical protein